MVLVASADPVVRQAVRGALEPEGYAVADAAADHSLAIEAARLAPLAVLLDARASAGAELTPLQELRARREGWALPVVVLADESDEQSQLRALAWRATDVVAGSLQPAVLAARIRALLGRG